MLAQRIYGLALGYEDLNDHKQLRQNPLLGVLAGKRNLSEPLAGKSTLNRLELTPAGSPSAERYNKIAYAPEAIDELLAASHAVSGIPRIALKSIVQRVSGVSLRLIPQAVTISVRNVRSFICQPYSGLHLPPAWQQAGGPGTARD